MCCLSLGSCRDNQSSESHKKESIGPQDLSTDTNRLLALLDSASIEVYPEFALVIGPNHDSNSYKALHDKIADNVWRYKFQRSCVITPDSSLFLYCLGDSAMQYV